ncbi:MAG: hypothetical protein LHV69_01095 [Elusimicrobia bacterium]|nr:hypothetical protein [Candidatus Obscuribacterium magneticum]
MKKTVLSLIFIATGSGLWWVTSQTARFNIKRWDAKFDTVLRSTLAETGLTNKDILSSLHEMRKSADGDWVVHRLAIKNVGPAQRQKLAQSLEKDGAIVDEIRHEKDTLLVVKRGSRIYQEITLLNR